MTISGGLIGPIAKVFPLHANDSLSIRLRQFCAASRPASRSTKQPAKPGVHVNTIENGFFASEARRWSLLEGLVMPINELNARFCRDLSAKAVPLHNVKRIETMLLNAIDRHRRSVHIGLCCGTNHKSAR